MCVGVQKISKIFLSVRYQKISRPETKTVKNGPMSFCFPFSCLCVCVCVRVCASV